MGEADEGIPITLIRGYKFEFNKNSTIKRILREKEIDLFRSDQYAKKGSILKSRRSYKLKFDSKRVDSEIVKKCIDIARWAPSAHNGQFWRYIIIKQGEIRKSLIKKMNNKLRNDLEKDGKPENYIVTKIKKSRDNFLKAPILILLCMDSEDLEKYPDDERNQNEFIMGIQSISASATYLLLAFELEKLASCWYSAPLFTKDVIRKTLNLPETYIPMAFFTAGYSLSQIKAPKRKSLEDIIYNPKL
jgi:coenzyme F420-0:L-glutamate ligase/coenzyme F420-1:gamma-L-glutamate ligase